MRAITIDPGVKDSADLEEFPEPDPSEGAILVDGVALGICGTDAEIVHGDYGEAPPGAERLILGHESLGRVAEAPDDSGFARKVQRAELDYLVSSRPALASLAENYVGLPH